MNDELRQSILAASKRLGVSPVDLGTVISYETAGTFDPNKAGPTTQWGQHRGLIQWGEPQAKKYLGGDFSIPSQTRGMVAYLDDAGVKPGMGLLDLYSAVNAGHVGRYNASDANNGGAPGTVRDKVQNQMAGHRQKAERLLGMSAYAGLPDGPKGQEAWPAPATELPGLAIATDQSGTSGGILGGIPVEVAQYAASDDDKKSPLQNLLGALSKIEAPTPPRPGAMGDARQSGGLLLQALNDPKISDMLLKKRLG